jgi:hypothetical protein
MKKDDFIVRFRPCFVSPETLCIKGHFKTLFRYKLQNQYNHVE